MKEIRIPFYDKNFIDVMGNGFWRKLTDKTEAPALGFNDEYWKSLFNDSGTFRMNYQNSQPDMD